MKNIAVNGNKEKNFISAIVYIHNCQNRIEAFLDSIMKVLEKSFEHSEIICVNDASDDRSLDVIREAGKRARATTVTVVNMSYFHGLERAMNAGVDLSIGDYVIEFDTTVQDYDPDVIMQAYRHCLKGYDIVSVSPDKKDKFSSRLFYKTFDRFSNLSYEMSTERFRVLSRRVINRVSSMNRTVLYRKALYANSGLKTDRIKYPVVKSADIPVDKRERQYRTKLAADSLILFTEMGYRFSIIMTAIMMLVAIAMIVYTVITYFTAHPVAGWTTTILFLSVCFFGLFGILTVIIKYLQLLLDMVFRRKPYSFESVEKL